MRRARRYHPICTGKSDLGRRVDATASKTGDYLRKIQSIKLVTSNRIRRTYLNRCRPIAMLCGGYVSGLGFSFTEILLEPAANLPGLQKGIRALFSPSVAGRMVCNPITCGDRDLFETQMYTLSNPTGSDVLPIRRRLGVST